MKPRLIKKLCIFDILMKTANNSYWSSTLVTIKWIR